MEAMRASALVCLLLLCFQLPRVQTASDVKNKKAIKTQQTLLEKSILKDLEKMKKNFNATIDSINKAIGGLKSFTDDSIAELKFHTRKAMNESDAILDKNLKILENYTNDRFDNFTETMLDNLERLSNHTAAERAAIISWAHTRNHRHEDILKTHVALCAHDHGHHGNTANMTVSYASASGGFMDGKKNWQVFNETCNNENCAMTVLNRTSGVFKPPKKASGLYMLTFSVTIDVWGGISRRPHQPAEYQFRKNGANLEGTSFYCNIGSSRNHDKVQGSKTILLKLGEQDEVDVVQLRDTDIADTDISFCGVLIHLEKASDSPGGIGEDATNPEFPKGTMPELCESCDSANDQCLARCLTDHKYAFGKTPDCESTEVPKCEFEKVAMTTTFNHDTKSAIPEADTKMDVATLKLKPLKADDEYTDLVPK